jgi:DNA processing protein
MKPTRLVGARLPVGLADLDQPPDQLFLWGTLPPQPWVAVVGTRKPSDPALAFTRKLAAVLSSRGATVVSGGAEGIDAAAHEGALGHGASTVVVAPSSFDRPYPETHGPLFERIVSGGGAMLSEYEHGVAARRHVFFARNALLVACATLVVVVESPLRSGARNAASWARRLGRPLWVVPHPPWHARGAGCVAELALGARPLGSIRQLLRALEDRGFRGMASGRGLSTAAGAHGGQAELLWERPQSSARAASAPQPSGQRVNVCTDDGPLLVALASGPASLDELHSRTGLPVAELQRELAELVLDGRASRDLAGAYRLLGRPS